MRRIKQWTKRVLTGACGVTMKLMIKVIGKYPFLRLIPDGMLIDALQRRAGRQEQPFYAVKVYHDFLCLAHAGGLERLDRVLELGPGSSLTTLGCFVAGGAEKAVGVDIQPMDSKPDDYYEEAGRYLAVASGFGWWRHFVEFPNHDGRRFSAWRGSDFIGAVRKVDYRAPIEGHHLPFENESFDYVYSNAVLEHVEPVEATVRELARVLRPGGITAHEIDLRDHDSQDPLEFLRFIEEEWRKVSTKYGDKDQGIERLLEGSWEGRVYCNRLRASDWVRVFEESGFEILREEPTIRVQESAIKRGSLAKPYSSMETDDLSIISVRILARRKS